jgi:Xanthine and CO dehydrogenases maturation factor, XdhC/CoxF family
MSELFEHLDRLRNAEGKVALATLVNTRGTTPRKEGAKMLVGEGGRILGSVTIGGCVDAQVIEEAASVLTAHKPRLLQLDLGDEEAWEIGLTCGGTIEVFVEPVDLEKPDDATLAIYERLKAHAEAGGRGAVLTRLEGSTDGAKMLGVR